MRKYFPKIHPFSSMNVWSTHPFSVTRVMMGKMYFSKALSFSGKRLTNGHFTHPTKLYTITYSFVLFQFH